MKRLVLLAFFLVAASLAFADSFTFSADSVQSVLAEGKQKTVLSGHAKVVSDKIAVSADKIEISGKDYSLLTCEGTVVADDKKNGIHLEAPRLSYDRDKSFAVLDGPALLEDGENHVVLKAQWIQDDGDQGITIAQVNVRILKSGLACRSEYAIYRRKEHLLELSGAPRVVKNGDEYRATRMVVNTDSEEISLEGSVSGTVHAASSTGTEQPKTTESPPSLPPDTAAPGQSPAPLSPDTAAPSPAQAPLPSDTAAPGQSPAPKASGTSP